MPNESDFALVRNFWGSDYPQMKVLARASDDQPTYIAYGVRGKALTTPNWKVVRIDYVVGSTGSNVVDAVLTSPDNSIASDYATLVYG